MHQESVRYLRKKLMDAGIPVRHTPSHIIPVHVSLFSTSLTLTVHCFHPQNLIDQTKCKLN